MLVICLNTPPRPTWGNSMHFCDQAPRPPPFNQITQHGWQSTGLELRIPKIYLLYAGNGPETFWRPPLKIIKLPQMTTHRFPAFESTTFWSKKLNCYTQYQSACINFVLFPLVKDFYDIGSLSSVHDEESFNAMLFNLCGGEFLRHPVSA